MTAYIDSPPQTNEVVRSAVLLGGFLVIAAATQMPLALYELGASAGLNMLFDRYAYDLGDGRKWGDASSPVKIAAPWSGAAPALDTPLGIASRQAVDLLAQVRSRITEPAARDSLDALAATFALNTGAPQPRGVRVEWRGPDGAGGTLNLPIGP